MGGGEAATNSARSADSYAEYLAAAAAAAAALTSGDGRSPGSLANLVTCFMRGVGICGFSDSGICTTHTHNPNSTHRHHFCLSLSKPRTENVIGSNSISKSEC